jgi:hypothetical protein
VKTQRAKMKKPDYFETLVYILVQIEMFVVDKKEISIVAYSLQMKK